MCGSSSNWLCCPEKLTNDVTISFADKDRGDEIPPTNVSPQEVDNFIASRYKNNIGSLRQFPYKKSARTVHDLCLTYTTCALPRHDLCFTWAQPVLNLGTTCALPRHDLCFT